MFLCPAGPSTPRAEDDFVMSFPTAIFSLKPHDWSTNQWNRGPPLSLLKNFFKTEDSAEYNF